MGKLKDRAGESMSGPVKTSGAPPKRSPGKVSKLAPFFLNFVKRDLYKPNQGKHTRWTTVAGLGVIVAVGLWRLFDVLDSLKTYTRYGIVAGLGVLFGWMIYRLVNFPPFAEFLVATEAEMRKVSWTSVAELKRATIVVLSTVLLMTLFLFGVDQVWSLLLTLIKVLRVGDASSFGEQAG